MRYYIFLFFVYLLCFISCTPPLDNSTQNNTHIYADKAFEYNGTIYHGREIGGDLITTKDESFTLIKPDSKNFNAEAFFTLEGNVKNNLCFNYALVTVTKEGTDLRAKYFPRNDFSFRIWLPFGEGKYIVNIYKLVDIDVNRTGEGNISGVNYDKTTPIYTFNVFNTCNEDGRFLYPSYFIQSDDDEIQKLADELRKGKNTDMEIIKAIHDYVCWNFRYDYESKKSTDPENKLYRRQDAKYVLDNKICVCEGYTSITAALLRACGIKAKAVIGTSQLTPNSKNKPVDHAWLHVLSTKDDVKKYRLLDPTNDDKEKFEFDKDNNYKFIEEQEPSEDYFLLDLENNEKDHRSTHFQGKSDKDTPFKGEDGLYEGTRPWR